MSTPAPNPAPAVSDQTAQEPSLFDKILTSLKDPLVMGGILVIVILIVVALLQTNSKSSFGSMTETATKYMLSNTPELLGYQ